MQVKQVARRRFVSSPTALTKQVGGTIIGLVLGVVIGLAIAAAVAFFLNKSPVPFVNKAAKGEKSIEKAGDPNTGLYGKDGKKDEKKIAYPDPLAPPKDAAKEVPDKTDKADKDVAKAADPIKAIGEAAAKAEAKAEPKAEAKAEPDKSERYFLQAGAFQSAGDADNQKAKLALMGFEARVETAEVEGKGTMYRVRLGPYGRLDDINRVRATLSQSGVDASLVRGKP